MQPIGAFGMVPQLVNPSVVMVPGGNSVKSLNRNGSCCGGKKPKRKGSCGVCGRCIGSLFIILFAFICTSCCYSYPIYNSFTNPEYFKKNEEPIWTWKIALNKAKEFGYSMSLTKAPEDENELFEENDKNGDLDKVQFLKLNSTNNGTATTFLNLRNYPDKNSSNLISPLYNNSYMSNILYSNVERKLNIRGGGLNLINELIGFKTKQIPNKYFDKEYCERGENATAEIWKDLCNFRHNVTNFECIDMMNGPAICVGIRNHKYEVFSVSKQCKFVDPEIPVEIFPAISDLCYSNKRYHSISSAVATTNITKPICPCMITSSPVDNMEFDGNTTTKGNIDTRDFIILNKTNQDAQKMLRGGEGILENPFNSSLIHFAAKSVNQNSTRSNDTSSLLNIMNS